MDVIENIKKLKGAGATAYFTGMRIDSIRIHPAQNENELEKITIKCVDGFVLEDVPLYYYNSPHFFDIVYRTADGSSFMHLSDMLGRSLMYRRDDVGACLYSDEYKAYELPENFSDFIRSNGSLKGVTTMLLGIKFEDAGRGREFMLSHKYAAIIADDMARS